MKRIGVLAADGLHIESGPDIQVLPHNLDTLVGGLCIVKLFWMAEGWGLGQLWVHSSVTDRYGVPRHEPAEIPMWNIWPVLPKEVPWYYGYRPNVHGDGIELAFPALDDRAAWCKAKTGQQLLTELLAYNHALGTPFSWSPGNTGSALIRLLHGGGQSQSSRFTRLDAPSEPPPPALLPKAPAREMAWIRGLSEQERECGWLHSFDKNGAYLGSSGTVELGLGEWQYVGSQFFHKGEKIAAPGYFCVSGYEMSYGLPDVLDPDGYYAIHPDRDAWVTTPALNAMLAYSPVDVAESYIWPVHSRVLAPWQARVSHARTDLCDMPLALQTLKDTYTATIGLLGSNVRKSDQQNMLYRPDWRHMIIGQSTANTWRRIIRAVTNGVSVVAAAADCIYVVSDTSDPLVVAQQAGIPVGSELKDCKVQDSVPLPEVLEFFGDERMGGYGTRYKALEKLRQYLGQVEVRV